MTRLSMTRGDLASFLVTFTDAEGDPLDLTGLDVAFTVKRSTSLDDSAVITKTIGEGIELTETEGQVRVTVQPDDTADLTWRSYVWDIQVDDGAGDVRTPLTGDFRIRHDVTATAAS